MGRLEVVLAGCGVSALHTHTGVCVPDLPPPFQFALPSWPRMMRTAEPYIAAGFTDAEAWDALFDDDQRLHTFRSVYGNRKGPVRRRSGQGALAL